MVSNTELSELLAPHPVPQRELSEFRSAYYLCVKAISPSSSQNSPSLAQNSVSSLFSETAPFVPKTLQTEETSQENYFEKLQLQRNEFFDICSITATETLPQFRRVANIGSLLLENPVDPQSPAEPSKRPSQRSLRTNFLGEPCRGLCPRMVTIQSFRKYGFLELCPKPPPIPDPHPLFLILNLAALSMHTENGFSNEFRLRNSTLKTVFRPFSSAAQLPAVVVGGTRREHSSSLLSLPASASTASRDSHGFCRTPKDLRSRPLFRSAQGAGPEIARQSAFWAPGSEVPKECFLSALWAPKAPDAVEKHSLGHSEPGAQKHSKSTLWPLALL